MGPGRLDAAARASSGLASPEEAMLPFWATHPYATELDITRAAAQALPAYRVLLQQLALQLQAGGHPTPNVSEPLIKPALAARTKVSLRYGGHWGQLTDLLRARVVLDDADGIHSAYRMLRQTAPKYGWGLAAAPEDRFATPSVAGLSDAVIRLRAPNALVAELQLHTKDGMEARARLEPVYEELADVERLVARSGWTIDQRAKYERAMGKALNVYEGAPGRTRTGARFVSLPSDAYEVTEDAELRVKHLGPGPHPSGTPQAVHDPDPNGADGADEPVDEDSLSIPDRWKDGQEFYDLAVGADAPEWVQGLPPRDRYALKLWIVNRTAQEDMAKATGGAVKVPEVAAAAAAVERAFDQAPEYHGPATRAFVNVPEGAKSLGITKVGQTFTFKTVASASKETSIALEFAANRNWGGPDGEGREADPDATVVVFRMKKTKGAADLSAWNEDEQEIVLRKGASFKVTKISKPERDLDIPNGGNGMVVQYVDLEPVAPGQRGPAAPAKPSKPKKPAPAPKFAPPKPLSDAELQEWSRLRTHLDTELEAGRGSSAAYWEAASQWQNLNNRTLRPGTMERLPEYAHLDENPKKPKKKAVDAWVDKAAKPEPPPVPRSWGRAEGVLLRKKGGPTGEWTTLEGHLGGRWQVYPGQGRDWLERTTPARMEELDQEHLEDGDAGYRPPRRAPKPALVGPAGFGMFGVETTPLAFGMFGAETNGEGEQA